MAKALQDLAARRLEPQEPYPGVTAPWTVLCSACAWQGAVVLDKLRQGRRACRGACATRASPRGTGSPRPRPTDSERLHPGAVLAEGNLAASAPYPGPTAPWPVRCTVCGWQGLTVLNQLLGGRRACRGLCARPGGRPALGADEAEARLRAAGFVPLAPYPGSARPWPARHLGCGQTSSPKLNNVSSRSPSFCSKCMPGVPLSADQARWFLETLGVRMLGEYQGARRTVGIRCTTCGLNDRRRYDDMRRSGVGCSYCAGKKMHVTVAVRLAEARNLEPLESFRASTAAWRCRCRACGAHVAPLPHALRSGGGCPHCAHPGFDGARPAVVYLLTHPQLRAYKFGITNTLIPTDRVKLFTRSGWQLLRTWLFKEGSTARDAENRIKHELRVVRRLPPFLSKTELPDGWTETVGECSLSARELTCLVGQAVSAAHLAVPLAASSASIPSLLSALLQRSASPSKEPRREQLRRRPHFR